MKLGETVTQAVLTDWRTAPIDERLKAMLGFLEKLTLNPEGIGPDDMAPVRAAGVTDDGAREAIMVCVAFSMIVRMADSLNFTHRTPEEVAKDAGFLVRFGYS